MPTSVSALSATSPLRSKGLNGATRAAHSSSVSVSIRVIVLVLICPPWLSLLAASSKAAGCEQRSSAPPARQGGETGDALQRCLSLHIELPKCLPSARPGGAPSRARRGSCLL